MSDDEDASKSNLVCNGQTQQWQAINVTFTSEGAKFDGTSSKMTLENVNFGDLSLGFTWLLRLKRNPFSEQAFLEIFDCGSVYFGFHFVEHNSPGKMSLGTSQQFTPTKFVMSRIILPNDANQFINIGVTAVPTSGVYTLYYNGSFLTDVDSGTSDVSQSRDQFLCYSLGYRCKGVHHLNGTYRSVGIVNESLTEAEILKFFSIIG
jgi:hypothetical protein